MELLLTLLVLLNNILENLVSAIREVKDTSEAKIYKEDENLMLFQMLWPISARNSRKYNQQTIKEFGKMDGYAINI